MCVSLSLSVSLYNFYILALELPSLTLLPSYVYSFRIIYKYVLGSGLHRIHPNSLDLVFGSHLEPFRIWFLHSTHPIWLLRFSSKSHLEGLDSQQKCAFQLTIKLSMTCGFSIVEHL